MCLIGMIGLTLGGTITCHRMLQNRLTVANHSGQQVSNLRIIVDGTSSVMTFKDIPIGGQVTSTYGMIWGDGYYDISGVLADGTKLTGQFGYLTNGMFEVHSRFIVKDGGAIEFRD
jgi:hypothetical protein